MDTGDVPGHDKAMGNEAEGRMWLGLDVKVLLGVPGCFSAEPCLQTSSFVSETHVGGPGDSSLPQDILDLDCSRILVGDTSLPGSISHCSIPTLVTPCCLSSFIFEGLPSVGEPYLLAFQC